MSSLFPTSQQRCMASSLMRAGFVRGSMAQGNGCYQNWCSNNTLEVAVDGIWKTCPEAGGPVQFPGFNGELICPAYHELCNVASVPGNGQCPGSCNFNGVCIEGSCHCFLGFHGHDCSKPFCDEQCSLHGGVCDNGVCEFRCSDYAGYTCQNSSILISSLSVCGDVLAKEPIGQHRAPSKPSILQQLEAAVVMPNYNRLMLGGRSLFSIIDSGYCDAAAKCLACWISVQRCDKEGENRLRVCHSACRSYNNACAAALDCSDQTLFSSEDDMDEQCTGSSDIRPWWAPRFKSIYSR